ncbi:Hypothetical protein Minf_0615 [Methylacidiphilum infernorum V4]|uniref:Uncharacterized protein n=1 Tax=Methylacidiphilum infernorum (isolate V4) TaxID=481448 RepID=B3E012_METI4|nr:Hypothetical protein Minf_0615 [Methylacidiphilum infernorum V4]
MGLFFPLEFLTWWKDRIKGSFDQMHCKKRLGSP